MLSNPSLNGSGGRSAATSTSISSKSRTERAYSVRVRRWKGRRPGFGFNAAFLSIADSSVATNALAVSTGGLGLPAGGITPTRNLRIIFSASSGFFSGCARSIWVSDMSPVFSLSLWQPLQYCFTIAFSASNVIAGAVEALVAAEVDVRRGVAEGVEVRRDVAGR